MDEELTEDDAAELLATVDAQIEALNIAALPTAETAVADYPRWRDYP